jgi:hypothetical protein
VTQLPTGPRAVHHGIQLVCSVEAQAVTDPVDRGDHAGRVTRTAPHHLRSHVKAGDLSDGTEHFEDTEALTPPDVVGGAVCATL